ncbi:ABC transporter ATP-binding protein [Geosporobacter ferrireducens]|uniref:ABC transporter ATP-binding protein n=1 Tax=Geosporobacter ferrireducens TaxID=1424294 RepID=A0A1D8GEL6_9FIRM|nr:ABC transporter ATP-binding protein [Geosporobacter ferrireducens]AOT69345.1 ABC transporter ATP-binding protein [Geosporobacter ferrireducens]MTI57031.1 ABC transporter ATP-binding protein [Geosporobacter ferrireducens]
MLKVNDLNVYYGGIHAIKGISLEVEEGQIVTLIGANGAGKTTILRTISGLNKAKSGTIAFKNTEIQSMAAQNIMAMGISQVPEGRRIFSAMTVLENLQLGAYLRKDKAGIKKDMERVFDKFPRLLERIKQQAGTLSGGEQQMLAMGRALMARPKLLLLDEPSMGLAPLLVQAIFSTIKELNQEGTTILLVEQNAHMALSIAHQAYVLETGRIVLSGDAKELACSPEISEAYLGGSVGH